MIGEGIWKSGVILKICQLEIIPFVVPEQIYKRGNVKKGKNLLKNHLGLFNNPKSDKDTDFQSESILRYSYSKWRALCALLVGVLVKLS